MTDESLLGRVATKLSEPPSYAEPGQKGSILTVAAASFGSKPTTDDVTQPTGFDPEAAALFEAVVESAYLVANADGDFDQTERAVFEQVVVTACQGTVAEGQVHALIEDLRDLMEEDGIDKRIAMVARTIAKVEHQQEVLRVAALLAHVSGGVSDVEREVLVKLQRAFGLDDSALARALAEGEGASG
ncbi:MAG: tellurite resistance TerB family protein [Myxococcales bacterium]|nr:tellurite resistance TerB family protein [Myxococcales bacterium]